VKNPPYLPGVNSSAINTQPSSSLKDIIIQLFSLIKDVQEYGDIYFINLSLIPKITTTPAV